MAVVLLGPGSSTPLAFEEWVCNMPALIPCEKRAALLAGFSVS